MEHTDTTSAPMPFAIKAIVAAVAFAILFSVAVTASPLFGMSGVGAIALYFICWWTTLFAVLPFGIKSQIEDGAVTGGTEPGAPASLSLLRKAGWTTIFGTIVYIAAALSLDILLG
jgi:predicted secreted protein